MASEMKIELRQISASTSEATIGRHRVLIDRPVAKGGSDAGPMDGELFLAAVGGCFVSNLLAAIKGREADISNVRVGVVGSLAESPGLREWSCGLPQRAAIESWSNGWSRSLTGVAS